VSYVVQEAVVVIKDIFRRYPNQYESIITVLCESLDTLDEPEAKVRTKKINLKNWKNWNLGMNAVGCSGLGWWKDRVALRCLPCQRA
jgi:hypothetical protein